MKEVFGKTVYEHISEIVQPRHTALLLVDVLNDFFSPKGYYANSGFDISMLQKTLPRLRALLEAARRVGVLVVHVQNTVLPEGRSDSSPFLRFKIQARDKVLTLTRLPVYNIEGTWGWEFLTGFEPQANEIVIKKHRPSAFVKTDLDQILKVNRIESVVVTGCVSEGCVQSTAIDALFMGDYYSVVASDCIGSYTQERHEAAIKFLNIRRIDVVESSAILSIWSEHSK